MDFNGLKHIWKHYAFLLQMTQMKTIFLIINQNWLSIKTYKISRNKEPIP